MFNLSLLSGFPVQGIYIIRNTAIQRCYIAHSTNMLKHLSTLISELKTNQLYRSLYKDIETYGIDRFEIFHIETYASSVSTEYLRIRLHTICTGYESSGYTLYNSYKGLQYTLTTRIGEYSKIYVEANYKPNRKVIIGVFDDVVEADKFVSCTNLSYPPITHDNQLTKLYFRKYGSIG